MDDRTKILVCLGSAVAANCVSCFRHYQRQGASRGLDAKDVQQAVELARRSRTGRTPC